MLDLSLIKEKFKETLSLFSKKDLLDWLEKDRARIENKEKRNMKNKPGQNPETYD